MRNYPATPPDAIRTIARSINPTDCPRSSTPAPEWLARWHLKGNEDFIRLIAAFKAVGKPVRGWIVGDVHPEKKSHLAGLEALVNELGMRRPLHETGRCADLVLARLFSAPS